MEAFSERRYLCHYFGLSQWPDIVIDPNVLMRLARAWLITKYPATLLGIVDIVRKKKPPYPWFILIV